MKWGNSHGEKAVPVSLYFPVFPVPSRGAERQRSQGRRRSPSFTNPIRDELASNRFDGHFHERVGAAFVLIVRRMIHGVLSIGGGHPRYVLSRQAPTNPVLGSLSLCRETERSLGVQGRFRTEKPKDTLSGAEPSRAERS